MVLAIFNILVDRILSYQSMYKYSLIICVMVLVSLYDSSGLLLSAYSEIHFLSRDKPTTLNGLEQVRCVLVNATRRWCLSRCAKSVI